MLKERNARIAAFQKVSGYLLWLYWPIMIFFVLILIALTVFTVIANNGEISLIEFLIKMSAPKIDIIDIYVNTKVSLPTRLLSGFAMMIYFAMAIYILFHFTKVIECFNSGNIFNQSAVYHARKAYKMNLWAGICTYGTQMVIVALCFAYADSGNGHRMKELVGNLFNFAIEIGILSLILWALEMGTDLNEESELTI